MYLMFNLINIIETGFEEWEQCGMLNNTFGTLYE